MLIITWSKNTVFGRLASSVSCKKITCLSSFLFFFQASPQMTLYLLFNPRFHFSTSLALGCTRGRRSDAAGDGESPDLWCRVRRHGGSIMSYSLRLDLQRGVDCSPRSTSADWRLAGTRQRRRARLSRHFGLSSVNTSETS